MPPPKDSGPTGAPVEWQLAKNAGRSNEEQRIYVQSELTIEGEARLLGLARQIGSILKDADYDLSKLGAMLDGEPQWDIIVDTLALLVEHMPALVADSACIFLGTYPNDELGRPNEDYDDHRIFIMRALNFTRWTDMVRVFVDQNDYQRLARPFWARIQQRPEWQARTEDQVLPPPDSTEASTD